MVLESPKSVPSSKQNKSRRSTDTAKSRGDSASKLRKQTNPRQPQKQPEPPKPAPKKKKKKPKDAEQDQSAQIQEPIRRVVKPENQLELSEKELEEDVTRILTGDDPNKPKNVCKFSFKDKCYKPDPPGQGDNMAIHFSLEGSSMHEDSDECKKYREREAKLREQEEPDAKVTSDSQTTTTSSGTSTASASTAVGDHTRNQFNFSERASQTFNNPPKSRGVHTEPPPITQYQDEVSQWKIHDSYKSDFLISQSMDGSARNISFDDKLASIVLAQEDSNDNKADTIHSENMEHALKTMERLVNQNAEDEVFQDFKYFEDRADQFRNGEGTLLPLWRFSTERANRKQVTSLCWNPRYNDLFAVGYGSYDFMRQGIGMVCCFSLKNTSYPEYVISTESGVMCLDFHPQHPSLLAVGCYDGTVLAYDISNGTSRPIYSSSLRSGKHSDPVWQVYWHNSGDELNFYSISSDGRVANWTMNKNELKMEPIMYLKLVNPTKEDSDEPTLSGLAGGCSFDFNKKLDNLFLVGTEEGSIHECSKAYSGQYIKTYDGHHMGVHTVRWNPFHEDIFISCSADWTVKIWDHKSSQCILHFDLGNAVGGVCWSPYSSTVFAAVTTDGKVYVFDLSQNKREPLCAQKVVKRARLTNAAFNIKDFILIVGDDRGGVHSLKLSPNLRKFAEVEEEKGKEEGEEEKEVDNDTIQNNKMVKLLASIDKKYAR
mmetsp:Transcript_18991/g.33423  ORF Transcript_18991/g.33423 Transcript_18991/m.33423 type:complete len:714 (+) Transcript_18991:248-2389(+)|eukprot:CAMPEP_0201879316 /NCGR_PEP_ID=MMETSP0902-20130614/10230_1 /ASSEMBLY_ACC=CAM_ASM_000551 /TAXON_ID=420261 /ORGANISM="Thalassiosira antarctica, Strain CCMP982" /LENGTH=713 /DNA_ID=CAMNT_0048407113 /DNA_START=59 /DNA_END=2200 /DNA_ORIENTATION=+